MNGSNSLQHKSIGNIIKIHYLRKKYTQHKTFNTFSLIKPIKYISIIISAIVATVYLLSMSLRLDTVQQKLASAITKEIETLLEVPISIGGIRVIHLDEIILKEIVVRDLSGDTALYAENVTANFSIPTTVAKSHTIVGYLNSSNANPNRYWDEIEFKKGFRKG